ncbi:hypothetical protein HPB48_003612 [Haemaphysalis longicornis]|uniref:Uncharacterized protein n=1 Tax=Haemaphysalis longicornis TaxID=44386 RepID=A0A9J6FET0_HAELO|nr:hypothetical protein HPB48_003612 [Haemaphysalis longicornis]
MQSRASSSWSAESEAIKTMREMIEVLRKENAQLRAATERNNRQMEELKELMKANARQQQAQQLPVQQEPQEKPEEEEVKVTARQSTTSSEPPLRKRAVESLRERKLAERIGQARRQRDAADGWRNEPRTDVPKHPGSSTPDGRGGRQLMEQMNNIQAWIGTQIRQATPDAPETAVEKSTRDEQIDKQFTALEQNAVPYSQTLVEQKNEYVGLYQALQANLATLQSGLTCSIEELRSEMHTYMRDVLSRINNPIGCNPSVTTHYEPAHQ